MEFTGLHFCSNRGVTVITLGSFAVEIKHSREVYASASQLEFNERNDCAVRAYATASCIDYARALELFAKHGRKAKHGTFLSVTESVVRTEFPNVFAIGYPDRPSLASWVSKHTEGHYMVFTAGHAFAVVDGVVHDWKPGERRRVQWTMKLV